MEVIISVIENQPGETIARHIHHGEEAFYVLQGRNARNSGRQADHSAGRRKRHQSP
jgi:mannose-6-phosphate isomerase-like protein (cupin superfamily)